jgi:hypothetical protein
MMPPPYHAVVNEGFIGDSLYEMPPSYESVVADNNNGSTTLLTVPPYSVMDPQSRSVNPHQNPSSQSTEIALAPPTTGSSSSEMVLQPLETDSSVPTLPHSSPPDVVTSALHSNQVSTDTSMPLPTSLPSPPSTSQTPPTTPPPSVPVETNSDDPKDSIEGEGVIINEQHDNH